MSTENEAGTRDVYETLCAMLDKLNYHYEKDEDNWKIRCTVRGEDLPMNVRIQLRPETQVVSLYSDIPIHIPAEKRADVALAVSAVNWILVDGSFDFDVIDGDLLFRMTASYRDSMIGEELLEYMLFVSLKTIDEFNDKFMLIAMDKMSLESFLDSLYKN